jgi:hypothetical protein
MVARAYVVCVACVCVIAYVVCVCVVAYVVRVCVVRVCGVTCGDVRTYVRVRCVMHGWGGARV